MPVEFVVGCLKLTREQWQRLQAVATELNTTAPTGQRANRPSWRTLIKEIANGDIVCVRARKEDAK